ncbi:MAG: tetratricopeptide repeat protein [Deltaproteobacteria bacterium]|nr:tetratricopeptide repeat protein [Deltaproteobacteria bacterium]
MSVIFEALKKLNNDSPKEDQKKTGATRNRTFRVLRRTFTLPRGVLSTVVFLIILGLSVTYASRFVETFFGKGNKTIMSSENEQMTDKIIYVPSEGGASDTDNEEFETEIFETVPEATTGTENPQTLTAQYLPPISKQRHEEPSGTIRQVHGRNILAGEEVSDSNKLPHKPMSVTPEKGLEYKAATRETPSTARLTPLPEAVSPSFGAEALPDHSPDPEDDMEARVERIRLLNIEKTAEISRLISRIEKSMAVNDMDSAKDLIDQLALLKGEENIYVMNIRAFCYMRQGDLDAAASILTEVLEKDQNALDAGINMAVIEIKTNQLEEAQERLAKLREIYHNNQTVRDLIEKVGRVRSMN